MFRDASAIFLRFINMENTPSIIEWNDTPNGIWYLP